MSNMSFSKKFSPQHDNGERVLCWRKGLPTESGEYFVTMEDGNVKCAKFTIVDKLIHCDIAINIIAFMKLPTPYKPELI